MLDSESDDDVSNYRSSGTCNFTFRFEDSVGHIDYSVDLVCGMDPGFFVLIGIDYNCDVVPLVMFVPIGVESKGGQLIEIFWRPKS